MKTTSTIKIKYPGHNTQKAAFPLCVMPTDTPNREDANRRKTDTTMLQVDAVVNAKLTKSYRLPAKYVIHTAAPAWYGGSKGEAELYASCYRCSRSYPSISTGVYIYSVDQAAKIAVDTVRETLKICPKIINVVFCCLSDADWVVCVKMRLGIGAVFINFVTVACFRKNYRGFVMANQR